MSPRGFKSTFVDGNIAEFRDNAHDLRRAANAIWAVDALAAHIWQWAKENAPAAVATSDNKYRDELAGKCESYRVLRDAANAMKHAELTRGNPVITSSEEIRNTAGGFQHGAFSSGFALAETVVWLPDGRIHLVDDLLLRSLDALEAEMAKLGVA